MPVVQPRDKVLVSGANGFIAIWIVKVLLERGYNVRGTVRSTGKGKYLQDMFAEYGDRLEIVIVEDIVKDGAFDEAVKGVNVIMHTASPVILDADDPQTVIEPAVKGTLGILKSAIKNGSPSLKRVVLTSSCAAVRNDSMSASAEPFTEENWNDASVKVVEEKGRDAPSWSKYRASKTLSEKGTFNTLSNICVNSPGPRLTAAWDLYNKHKPELKWDLAVILPPYVYGPCLQEMRSLTDLNVSVREWRNNLFVPGLRDNETLATEAIPWVDVRDLAEGHVRALEREGAGGERIIISGGVNTWQDWLDVAHSIESSPAMTRGIPGAGVNAVHKIRYDNAKGVRLLGMEYRGKEEVARDMLADFGRRGW
ncbi:D-lactaldehyde dehydrogenase [Infundibulicybe gibba]|nr:D-lactaldehyde dehydrogenase [Infundibulicybe gibba]